MKKSLAFSFFLLACLALVPQRARAQNFSTVTASHLSDASGNLIVSGTICFLGTDANDNPIAFRPGGGGQAIIQEVCAPIAAGAIVGAFQVANPANTSPANIAYRVILTSRTPRGNLRYNVVQFTGSPFNFDNYVPTSVPIPLGESANVFSVGQLIITGSCTGCSGGILTLSTNGTNNSTQTALNFQNGSTVNGLQIQPSNPSGANEQFAISGIVTVPGGGTGLGTLAAHQLYVGNGTSTPNPVALGTNGQVLESGGPGVDPAFQDPIVSGPDAVGATPTKNPVAIGCLFLTSPATLTNDQIGEAQCDSTQHLLVDVVNSTLAATQSGNWAMRLQDGSGNAITSTSSALDVNLKSSSITLNVSAAQSGNWTTRIVGNAGGVLDAVQNAAAPANALAVGCVYNSSFPSITGGDLTQFQCDSNGRLAVDIYSFNGTSWSPGGPWPADNSAFTAGTTQVGVIGAWYSSSPTACTSGDLCAPSMTSDRKLFVQDFQGTSPWVVSANGGTFAVTESGTWTNIVTQATGSNLHMVCDSGCSSSAGFADNSAFTVGTTAINPIGGLYDTGADPTITNGSAARARIDSHSYLLADIGVALPAGSNVIGGVTGSGNFTVVQGTGTNLHIVCDSGCSSSAGFADNSAFTVGTTAINPIGGLYDTGADPTIANGNAGRARIDSHSYLFTDLTALAGTVLGAPSNYGTSPGAVEVLGVNAYITNVPAVSQSGTWTVQQGGAPWTVTGTLTNNNAAPGATNVGALVALVGTSAPSLTSGDQSLLSVDTSGNLRVWVSGTVAATQSGNWTSRIVGNAGGVLDAAGQNASSPANELLIGGQYNSSPTTITSGNMSPLQLDSAGNLKVNLNANSFGTLTVTGTGGTFPVTGTFWQSTQPVSCTLANCAEQAAGLPESTSTYAATTYEVDALTTAAAVKASAGNVYGWYVYNPNASTCFLEVFNTASPTLGTTAPILSLGIPATSAANIPPGAIAVANFSTAIEAAATTASKGSSTCGTGMTVNLWYN